MKCENPDCETGHVRTGTCDWYGFPHMQKCPNCNGTGKQPEEEQVEDIMDFVEPSDYVDTQHDSSEEIREAFEEEYSIPPHVIFDTVQNRYKHEYRNVSQMADQVNSLFGAYKSATAKAQAEIERLEQSAITMAEVYQNTLDKLKKQYKTEEHKCCGHCKRESDHDTESDDKDTTP